MKKRRDLSIEEQSCSIDYALKILGQLPDLIPVTFREMADLDRAKDGLKAAKISISVPKVVA